MTKKINLNETKSVKQLLQEIENWQCKFSEGLRAIGWNIGQIIRQLMSKGMSKTEANNYILKHTNLSLLTVQRLPRAIEVFASLTDKQLSCLGLSVLCSFGSAKVTPKAIAWAKKLARSGKTITLQMAMRRLHETGSTKTVLKNYGYRFSFTIPGLKTDAHVAIVFDSPVSEQDMLEALSDALFSKGVEMKPIRKAA